eukprot:4568815-Prymnesium_polylepis.1
MAAKATLLPGHHLRMRAQRIVAWQIVLLGDERDNDRLPRLLGRDPGERTVPCNAAEGVPADWHT